MQPGSNEWLAQVVEDGRIRRHLMRPSQHSAAEIAEQEARFQVAMRLRAETALNRRVLEGRLGGLWRQVLDGLPPAPRERRTGLAQWRNRRPLTAPDRGSGQALTTAAM